MLVRTVGIDAMQGKASANGAEQKVGVVKNTVSLISRTQLEMDVMDHLVDIMNINVC